MEATEQEDWPDYSQRPQLEELDRAAQCGICHSTFDAPLSLLCGHSFCSECLRSNIQYQEQTSGKVFCPQCRQPADSRQVVPNHQLRDLVKALTTVRIKLVEAVRFQRTEIGSRGRKDPVKKRQRVVERQGGVIHLDTSPEPDESGRQLRKRAKRVEYFPKAEGDPEESDEEISEESEKGQQTSSETSPSRSPSLEPKNRSRASSKGPSTGKNQLPANWVVCPCCTQHFPSLFFNDHLDKCLENGKHDTSALGQQPKLKVPPKLLLAIEKDKSLRDRLKRYNLSTKGTRQDLHQRYNRFRVEVQTAVDRSEIGATYASLARRVMSRELNASNASTNGRMIKSSTTRAANGSNFDDLIKATRQRAAQRTEEQRKPSDSLDSATHLDTGTLQLPQTAASEGKDEKLEGQANQGEAPPRARSGRRFGTPAAPASADISGNVSSQANGRASHAPDDQRPAELRENLRKPTSLPWASSEDLGAGPDVIEDSESEEL